jgi:hypothetical protein
VCERVSLCGVLSGAVLCNEEIRCV